MFILAVAIACLLFQSSHSVEIEKEKEKLKTEWMDLKGQTYYLVRGKDIPDKLNVGPGVPAEYLAECAEQMEKKDIKVGVLKGKLCYLKNTLKKDEILCKCGKHIGNYTLDLPSNASTIAESLANPLSKQLGVPFIPPMPHSIESWVKGGSCDIIEKQILSYECKNFQNNSDSVIIFKKEE